MATNADPMEWPLPNHGKKCDVWQKKTLMKNEDRSLVNNTHVKFSKSFLWVDIVVSYFTELPRNQSTIWQHWFRSWLGAQARAVCMLPPSLRHIVPLNNGNCLLTMPISKGCQAHDVLHHTFDIGVFKTILKNSTIINIFTINLKT